MNLVPSAASSSRRAQIEEVLAIRQEVRPAMATKIRQVQSRPGAGYRDRCAPFGRNPEDGAAPCRRKNDSALATPTSPPTVLCIADDLYWSAISGHTLQLAISKETDLPCVR